MKNMPSMDLPRKIFVYGTLKRGHANEDCMENAKFLGEFWTGPGFNVYHLGFAPAMVRTEDGTGKVKGELFEVSDIETLRLLDSLEGVSRGVYTREFITLEDGQSVEAYLQPVARLRGYGIDPVSTGIWPPVDRKSPFNNR